MIRENDLKEVWLLEGLLKLQEVKESTFHEQPAVLLVNAFTEEDRDYMKRRIMQLITVK